MLEHLIGTWTLRRRVVLTSGALMATMEGIARFALLVDKTCQYSEVGMIKMADVNQASINFSRRYIYRDEQDELVIYFDEIPLRLFQKIAFTAIGGIFEATATHYCSQDIYTSHYQLRLPDNFQVQHHVEGPRKAYTIVTEYERSTHPQFIKPGYLTAL